MRETVSPQHWPKSCPWDSQIAVKNTFGTFEVALFKDIRDKGIYRYLYLFQYLSGCLPENCNWGHQPPHFKPCHSESSNPHIPVSLCGSAHSCKL